MSNAKDDTPKFRTLRMLRMIVESPRTYTRNDLAKRLGVGKDAILDYFNEIKNAGFNLIYDKKYRYYIDTERQYEYLKELLYFSEKDQNFILDALAKIPDTNAYKSRLLRKMESIYDFTRMGSHLISGQFMTKMNLLEKAKKEQKVVVLKDYHSTNSATISDKKVEPFHILANEDVLHAFDVEAKQIKHYRISRIKGVEVLEEARRFENHHNIVHTDPFRISNNNQIRVRMTLRIGGYNELLERFPATYGYLTPTVQDKEIYLLDCKVNASFIGLTNFILGNHHHIVELLEPESLIEHIKEEVKKINF